MTETFVDLLYRGLPLGRRIKLTQVRPNNGYLEHPTPMPVGTAISVATDDGFVLDAVVTGIHEQVGGSEVAPGMRFAPALANDQMTTWWQARVTLPAVDPPKTPPKPVPPPTPAPPVLPSAKSPTTPPLTVRPRSSTIPEPVDPKKTTVMPALDQELLEQLARNPDEIERLQRKSGEYAVIDDGMRTTVMDAVDPAALGLDVTSSGSIPIANDDDDGDDNGDEPSPGDSQPIAAAPGGAKKKKRKKRR